MDERMKRRILLFNLAGVINLALGGYVLLFGSGFLESDKIMIMSFFFFAFAAVDFYFPYAMKRKWQADQAERAGTPPAG